MSKKKPTQEELLELLMMRIYDSLSLTEIIENPKDIAALGNLVISLQKRQDDIDSRTGKTGEVIAFPALPSIPASAKRVLQKV